MNTNQRRPSNLTPYRFLFIITPVNKGRNDSTVPPKCSARLAVPSQHSTDSEPGIHLIFPDPERGGSFPSCSFLRGGSSQGGACYGMTGEGGPPGRLELGSKLQLLASKRSKLKGTLESENFNLMLLWLRTSPSAILCVCITKREKAESEAQRDKPKA